MKSLTPHRLREGLNALVRPYPISVIEVAEVADDWHARFSCIGRRYLYRILNRRAPPALDAGRVWHVAVPLDPDEMGLGAAHLIGRHDFTTFRSVQCQSDSPVKSLDVLGVRKVGEEIHITAAARSFSTIRCARWWAVSHWLAVGNGNPTTCARHWRHGTARRLASTRLRRASISSKRFTPDDYSAARASNSISARYFSASSAAMQPVPAAVTAWR